VQLPTTSGHWLTAHAWRLTGREQRIAVSVAQSRPGELTSHILHGYGLSDREIQVTPLALLGHSTAHIAKALFLPPYTVQDHLKAVFDKTGVRSRCQLAAHLFFNQNLPIPPRGRPVSRLRSAAPLLRGNQLSSRRRIHASTVAPTPIRLRPRS